MSIAAAARKGHRQGLEAMRDKLAADMDAADPSVVAQIAGRLQAVLKELAEMTADSKGSKLDDLAKRRANRIAGTDPSASAAGSPQQRRRRGS